MTEQNDDLQEVKIDPEVIRAKASDYSTEKLCEMVVCDRYFGCYRDVAVICMEELARRRTAGSTFDFEKYIDECLAKLPKLDFSIPNIRDVLSGLAGTKGFTRR